MRFARIKILQSFLLWLFVVARSASASETVRQPEPQSEHVPFPKGYPAAYQIVRVSNQAAQTKVGTIYANATAAAVGDLAQLPYSDGAIFVMEWADPARDARGELLVDAAGNWLKGEVTRIDVMRRQKGFGKVYGEKRAGEWEFASYKPDGTPFSPTLDLTACAACHTRAAKRDFVFRGRFPAIK